jgi:hypothetical protein
MKKRQIKRVLKILSNPRQTEQIQSLRSLKTQSVQSKKPQDCVFLEVLIQRPIHETQRKAREIPKMIPLVVQMKKNLGGTNRLKLMMMTTATLHQTKLLGLYRQSIEILRML